jgi:hypothetical protein
MSSLEVIEGIVGIQTTLEETIKVYASGKNDIQLSEPFVVVGQQLPVLLQLLQDCKCHLELRKDSLSQDSLETWEGILDSCDEKARKLSQIFKKVISCPGEKSAWRKRYTEIIRRYGRGNTVDGLMTALTQGVRLLVNSQEVSSASSSQNIQLEHILSEVQLHKESRLEEANQTAQTFNSRVDQINNFNQGSGQQINNNAPVETLNLTNGKQ